MMSLTDIQQAFVRRYMNGNECVNGVRIREINGENVIRGKVGGDLLLEEGRQAARATALSILATLRAELGDLDRIARIVKVFGMVNVAPGFNQTPAVIDGCSDLLVKVFGEAGRHTRSAVGLAELPFDIAVEIELTARLRSG